MWEKQIFHPGLKVFRVIRGGDQGAVELMAKLQTELWDERWRKIQLANAKRKKEEEAARVSFQQKELALQRTREAERLLDSLIRILRDGIEIDHVLDWEKLKDRSPFSEPKPEPREQLSGWPAPQPDSVMFSPRLTFVDWLIPSRRSRRVAEAQRRYLDAKAECSAQDQQIREANARQQTEYEVKLKKWTAKKLLHSAALAGQHAEVNARRAAYEARQPDGLVEYWSHVLFGSEYPEGFPKSFALDYVAETQTVVIEYELPDIECLPSLKELKYIAVRDELREVKVSDAWLNRTYDDVLYQICLRTVQEIFQSDTVNAASSVVFNGWVNYVDKSNGQEVNACVLSLQVTKEEFSGLNLAQVEPKACFRSLKGISGSKLASRSAVRPILQLNKQDKRFVPSHDVAYELDDSFNLAAMDWLDFENLIREIFEKEFRSNGGEVKITRASRDGGVDAIAFDPDPIRGGKIVIQAKRYTNTVGVSAVRDLFGTVHNEGATKGILVTTSIYGPDAYEFAKGKPLTLLNGSELLYLLQKHGHKARIDLAEAKRLEAERREPGTPPH
jgi:restriction system protein